jgi:hypothetical protein
VPILRRLFGGEEDPPQRGEVAPAFVPGNDLERSLVLAQQGQLPIPALMRELGKHQVVVLLDRELPESGQWESEIQPLVLSSPGGQTVLAIFTSIERASPMASRSSSHKFALLVDFNWALHGVGPEVGLVINPGWPVGFEMPAQGVAQIRKDAEM